MPGFFVTGCLFIPETSGGKSPAVLNVIGHNQEAFRDELYQILYLNLVKKGFVVLAIDPIGQGENVQYYDPSIQFSSVGYSVIEQTVHHVFIIASSPRAVGTDFSALMSRRRGVPPCHRGFRKILEIGIIALAVTKAAVDGLDSRTNPTVACGKPRDGNTNFAGARRDGGNATFT